MIKKDHMSFIGNGIFQKISFYKMEWTNCFETHK